MLLSAGARLGPYQVESVIGKGGMGEVYRAKDTRLERTVAIKILPPHLAADPDFRERFEREAKSISSLNHPNICTLYDVGREGGTEYLVLEYLEGESLADRLRKGPLPLKEALRLRIGRLLFRTFPLGTITSKRRAGLHQEGEFASPLNLAGTRLLGAANFLASLRELPSAG